MAYVYRYIDIKNNEVCYIGKVTKEKTDEKDPLRNRHRQHTKEKWYEDIGDENVLMQYIECSHTDADIFETWLINYYDETGQLINVSKTNWGQSRIDLYSLIFGRWRNYAVNAQKNKEELYAELLPIVDTLFKHSDDLDSNLDEALGTFAKTVREIANDRKKARKISRYDMQDDFIRARRKE